MDCVPLFQQDLFVKACFLFAGVIIYRRYIKVCKQASPDMRMDKTICLAISAGLGVDIWKRSKLRLSFFYLQRQAQTKTFALF